MVDRSGDRHLTSTVRIVYRILIDLRD